MLNVIESKNQETVRARNDEQVVKARENHKFHLIYWDVIRELREAKIDEFVRLVKKQKFKKMLLAFMKISQVVRNAWKWIDWHIKEEQIKRFRAMRSRQIQQKYNRFLLRFGPDENARAQKQLQQWFTWRAQTINMAYKKRSRTKMSAWLHDIAKNKQLKNKFLAKKDKMEQCYKTVVRFCNHL